jgi:hypothetical protein
MDGGRPVSIASGEETSTGFRTVVVGGISFDVEDTMESGDGFAASIHTAYAEELENRLSAIVGSGNRALGYEGLAPPDCERAAPCERYPVSEIAEIRHKMEAGYLGLSALASETPLGETEDGSDWSNISEESASWALGPRFTLFHAIAPDLALRGDVTLLHQDGWRTTAEGGLAKVFSNDLTGFATGGVERFEADGGEDLDYWSFFGGVGIHKELPWSLATTGQIGAKRRLYDGSGESFTDLAAQRRDLELGTTVSLWARDLSIFGYAPVVEYSFTWNGSNVGFFDYTSHSVDFRLSKDF